jgi:hypothetical protein
MIGLPLVHQSAWKRSLQLLHLGFYSSPFGSSVPVLCLQP